MRTQRNGKSSLMRMIEKNLYCGRCIWDKPTRECCKRPRWILWGFCWERLPAEFVCKLMCDISPCEMACWFPKLELSGVEHEGLVIP